MGKNIIKKLQEYQAAKKEMLKAEVAISMTDAVSGSNVCKKNLVLVDETIPLVCEHFETDDFCDNLSCHMFRKNAHYIFALRKYKEARRDFIASLTFWRSK